MARVMRNLCRGVASALVAISACLTVGVGVLLAMLALGSLGLFALAPTAAAAELDYPLAVAAAESGPIYLADRNLPGVWKLDGENLTLLFQASKKFRTPLNAVRCVALDRDGKLLAGDSATRDIYRFDDQGQPVALTKGEIGIPMAIATNKAGEIFVADLEVHVIWKVPAAGGKPEKFAAVPAPRGLAFDGQDRLWVVSHGKDQVVRLSPTAQQDIVVKGRPFQFPHNIVVADDGAAAFVTDGYAKAVWKIGGDAEPQKLAEGDPLVNPVGLARRGADLLVADPRAKAIVKIDAAGKPSVLTAKPAAK